VLLVTEGTYPYHFGGVSTWCNSLVRALPQVRFTLMALVGDRKREPLFALPPNVDTFCPVSLWGSYDLLETRHDLSFDQIRRRRRATTEALVQEEFVPAFGSFLDHLLEEEPDIEGLARSIVLMHQFFIAHDFDAALRSRAAWTAFADLVRDRVPSLAGRRGLGACEYGLSELTRGMQWIYRWLFPLARPIPRVDVTHAAMAGLCTLVAVAARFEHGAGYLLTEHGIYLRECYLAAARSHDGALLKLLRLSFARRMAELSYALADQVGPVCDYNHRWELKVGAAPDRLRTMYYGVDSNRFQPVHRTSTEPVVVWVGRIDPLKDLHTLLRAAGIVHRTRPDIRFRLYGGSLPGAEAYHQQCLALQHELGLDEVVTFAGYVDRPAAAFNEGDVVVLSSISEAVPFSNLEAMLCGKPVIATAVGGVPEQLAGCGVVVEPRNPQQLAAAVLDLMSDPVRRAELGRAAREKAMHRFGMVQFADDHLRTYRRLSRRHRTWTDEVGASLSDWRVYAPDQELAPQASPSVVDEMRLLAMAREIDRVGTSPAVDSLEVAALLESMGTTDQTASTRFGARDVFELAEAVFTRLQANHARRPSRDSGGEDDSPRGALRSLREVGRGPLALLQLGVLLSIMFVYARLGGWKNDEVFALGLGMSTSILVTSALIQTIGRRPSIYLGLGDRVSAQAALRLGTLAAGACIAELAFLSTVGGYLSGAFTLPELLIFVTAFAAFSAIWIAAAGLMIVQSGEWLVVALAVGLAVDLGVDRGLGLAGPHLAVGTAAGFATTVALVLIGVRLAIGGNENAEDRAVLPSHGYLVHEAGPYLAYGSLYMAFFVLPHVLGWLGALAPGEARGAAIQVLEHGLTLGLPPVLVAAGLAEHAAGTFWRHASAAQRATPGDAPAGFGDYARRRLYVPQLSRHLVVLGATSAALWVIVQSGTAGGVTPWLLPPHGPDAELVFVGALLAYGMLGWGLFNSTYTLSLARPELALRALVPAVVVTLAAGVPLSLLAGFGYAVIAFAAGTTVFVVTSSRTTWSLLRSADYHYFASV
jgi:glycosyltransferase involved in cell wall biosynthesis